MTPNPMRRAYRLWKSYKTDTAEYREIAEQLGLTTAELNKRCWHMNHDKMRQVKP